MGRLLLAAVLLLLQAVLGQQQRACPDVCSCIGATNTMDCTPRPDLTGTDFRFTSIPQNGPLDVRIIIMTGNSLTSLAPGSFDPYPSLETVVLNDNLFTQVPSEGFHNLSITNLTFDGNPLTELGVSAFSNLTSLQHLSIRRTTSFGSIDGRQVFDGLDGLSTLSLDDNLLRDLPEDFLGSTPQLTTLSLRNNMLQTLAEDFLSPITMSPIQIDLSLNPWSCDCFLRWLRLTINATSVLDNDEQTVCHWPPAHNTPQMTQISQVPAVDYQCEGPTITANPANSTLLSNASLAIPCGLDAAPFPEVTWTRDGMVVNFTVRVHISRYDATLRFESQGVEDSGEYQCLLVNGNGTAESDIATITVLESTCFDNSVTRDHETDLDCGGQFCVPCNITKGCLLDRDCAGELVCLYGHSLPSSLHYISPFDPDAYTCAEPTVPPVLLEAILQSELPLDISLANVSTEADTPSLHRAMHDYLALQLGVSRATIANVRVSSVEKIIRPLIQVWFDLPKSSLGDQAGNRLMEQIDDGSLRATVRRKEEENFVSYRLNL